MFLQMPQHLSMMGCLIEVLKQTWFNVIQDFWVNIGSGQTFSNASALQNVLYIMSLGGRFRYYYKRNTSKNICVVCIVNECQ